MSATESKEIPAAEKLAATNEAVDLEQIREARAQLQEFRETGLTRHEYAILPAHAAVMMPKN